MGIFNCFFDRILPAQRIVGDRQLDCLQPFDLIAQAGGFLKFQILCRFTHIESQTFENGLAIAPL